jgi:hypothetical protein
MAALHSIALEREQSMLIGSASADPGAEEAEHLGDGTIMLSLSMRVLRFEFITHAHSSISRGAEGVAGSV